MNWAAINFDWNQVRAFLATVEEGSLSAAARVLGQTQPTVGRQVTALEERLDVVLFERSGRTLTLTPSGLELAEHVRTMGDAATQLSLVATGQATSVEGIVRVTASEMYAAHVLPKAVAELRKTHPGIIIEIVATNAVSDLRLREADIAIRNTEPTDPEMIARRMPDDTGTFFATPEVLRAQGPFNSASDLKSASLIGFDDNARYLEYLANLGLPFTEENFVVRTKNHLVHWALARAGLGLGMVPLAVGDADPTMVRAVPWLEPISFPVWLVAPRELKTSRRVRIVFDALVKICGADGD